MSIFSCKKYPPSLVVPEQGECLLETNFKYNAAGCSENSPILYAHFIEQSINDDICFADVFYNQAGALECAPGPFLIEDGSVVDVAENIWELTATPDYLVWHLDDKLASDESFYITNRHGFPIKSQSIRLENNSDATVVLLPKTDLVPGVKYYLYLMSRAKGVRQTWIQPLAIKVRAKQLFEPL